MMEEGKLPKGWKVEKLANLVVRMTNGSSLPQKEEPEPNDLPITRIETIATGKISLDRVKYISKPDDATIEKYKLIEGDILFSHINSDKHLGKTAIFKMEDTVLIHGINLLLIRAAKGVDSRYLNYVFNYYRNIGKFIEVAQHSVNQSSINQKKLNSFDIPVPPFTEQQRIAAKLDALMENVESLQQRAAQLPQLVKKFRQAVLAQAVSGELTKEWREKKEVNIQHWQACTLNNICEFDPGKTGLKDIDKNQEVSFVPMFDLEEEQMYFNVRQTKKLSEVIKGYTFFRNNDVLLARITPCFENGKTGIARNLRNGLGFGSTEYIVLRCKEAVIKEFIYFLLKSSKFRQMGKSSMQGAVGQQRVPKSVVKNYPVSLPPLAEQQEIVRRVEELFALADRLEEGYEKLKTQLEQLPQAILARAFRGELVSQLPGEEPVVLSQAGVQLTLSE